MTSADWSHANPMFVGGSDEEATAGTQEVSDGKSIVRGVDTLVQQAQPITHFKPDNDALADSVAVLPVVDVFCGTVEFCVAGTWEKHVCLDAGTMMRSLLNSVRPVRWSRQDAQLIVTIARRGSPGGHEIRFFLAD